MLHDLRVRSYESATRAWHQWIRTEPIGSVLGLQRGGSYLFVTGHASPSASQLLVLTDALTLKRELDGWPKLVLSDGRVIFSRSMVHFAPTHAEALALYDPNTNRELSIYPDASVQNQRGIERVAGTDLLMDRSVDSVKQARKSETIQFEAREQHMRIEPAPGIRAQPASAEHRMVIQCDLAARPISCSRGQ